MRPETPEPKNIDFRAALANFLHRGNLILPNSFATFSYDDLAPTLFPESKLSVTQPESGIVMQKQNMRYLFFDGRFSVYTPNTTEATLRIYGRSNEPRVSHRPMKLEEIETFVSLAKQRLNEIPSEQQPAFQQLILKAESAFKKLTSEDTK